ncbi:hypothetical protein ASC97_22685 [Rhizobium sp. Root1203]|uniref:hypothetical protein n=1 Tax=Rhizobium sp. Root1203 TaxID=1736427 RepID=UPI00070B3F4D|nr:hypothetical protein [Rhizobium sp. Root1203]KQV30318.1 hypothetical protein ASC97_22685 [Rhizobium sp. Root1203]
MSVPFEPIVPPPSVPPLDNPPSDPDRISGEEPFLDSEPDEGAAPISPTSSQCPTWGMLCQGVRLQPEDHA